MIAIPLTRGMVALIDDEDVALAQFKWRAMKNKRTFYAVREAGPRSSRRTILLHRAVLGIGDGIRVDHKDGDGLNCRRRNLRAASTAQNNCNARRRRDNSSGYKGVYWKKDKGRWEARVKIDGKDRYIGRFASAEAAAQAYDAAARILHGEFAKLNFPSPDVVALVRAEETA